MEQHLSYYKIFYEVAKCGSISQAANTLFISQPAISKAIQKLEKALFTQLFIRSSKGVKLTEDGEILLRHVEKAFISLSDAETHLKRRRKLGIGHLRIGASTTLCRHILLPILKNFTLQNPHIRISINCQSTSRTLSLLNKEKIDIGLGARPDHIEDYCFYSMGEIEDIFISTQTYLDNLTARGAASTEEIFKNGTLMLLDQENMTRQHIDAYIQQNQLQLGDMIEISSMDLLIEFAKINLGIACVVKEFVMPQLKDGTFIEIPLGIPIHKREVGFFYAKQHKELESLTAFLKAFEDISINAKAK